MQIWNLRHKVIDIFFSLFLVCFAMAFQAHAPVPGKVANDPFAEENSGNQQRSTESKHFVAPTSTNQKPLIVTAHASSSAATVKADAPIATNQKSSIVTAHASSSAATLKADAPIATNQKPSIVTANASSSNAATKSSFHTPPIQQPAVYPVSSNNSISGSNPLGAARAKEVAKTVPTFSSSAHPSNNSASPSLMVQSSISAATKPLIPSVLYHPSSASAAAASSSASYSAASAAAASSSNKSDNGYNYESFQQQCKIFNERYGSFNNGTNAPKGVEELKARYNDLKIQIFHLLDYIQNNKEKAENIELQRLKELEKKLESDKKNLDEKMKNFYELLSCVDPGADGYKPVTSQTSQEDIAFKFKNLYSMQKTSAPF